MNHPMGNQTANSQKLTVIVPSFNEEKSIERCLKSVRWADELLVVDSYSTDRTLEIASNFADRIIQHEYENSARQKNRTIPQALHEWVLIVDSDERVSSALADEIQELLRRGPDREGYWIYRTNYLLGKPIKYSGWGRDKVLRLFCRDLGRYSNKRVHAEVELENTGILSGRIDHYSISDMPQWVSKINRYSSWKAEDKFQRQTRMPVLHLLFRPPIRFLKDFIFRLGFLDGWRGFLIAAMSAYAEFMMSAKLTRMTYTRRYLK
jgi:glycosyltransferase involved in cell wall biosynthesis